MIEPRPSAMRLSTTARLRRPPPPPFRLLAWTPDADALAVLLDASLLDPVDVSAVTRQLPAAASLPFGATVAIFGDAIREGHLWTRLIRGSSVPVSRAVRCGALVVRGYVDVGAGVDESTKQEIAWGRAPGREPG